MNIKEQIVEQFKQPHNILGQLAGIIMANRPSNIERNAWTLELLDVKPTDHLLEIGFGPGVAIEMASRLIQTGLIVGVDHSETMLHQASKRNAQAIRQGKVQLHLGTAETLPYVEQPFDKIFSANVVQFWDKPERSFAHLYDALAQGGTIATTYMPRHAGANDMDARNKAAEIARTLTDVGFKDIEIKQKLLKPASVICVLAKK